MNKDEYDYQDIETLKKLFEQYKANLGIILEQEAARGSSTTSHNEKEEYLKKLRLLKEKIRKQEQDELQEVEFIKNKNINIKSISHSLISILTKKSGKYTDKIITYSYIRYVFSTMVHFNENILIIPFSIA